MGKPTRRVLFTYLTIDTFQKCITDKSVDTIGTYVHEGIIITHRDVLSILCKITSLNVFYPVTELNMLKMGLIGFLDYEKFALYFFGKKIEYDFRLIISDISGKEVVIQRFNGGWYDERDTFLGYEHGVISSLLFSLLQETNRVQGMPDIEVKIENRD